MSCRFAPIKKLLAELTTEAYERELHRKLAQLDQSFAEWRNGHISSGELSHRIHQYDIGPSRELYKRYNDNPHEMSVAYAIVVGILQRDEMPVELLEAIAGPLSSFQSMKDRNELGMPDE
jgi:hypothetical protein